jgi:hypothetical protein
MRLLKRLRLGSGHLLGGDGAVCRAQSQETRRLLFAEQPDRLPVHLRMGLEIGDQLGHGIATVPGNRLCRLPTLQIVYVA